MRTVYMYMRCKEENVYAQRLYTNCHNKRERIMLGYAHLAAEILP